MEMIRYLESPSMDSLDMSQYEMQQYVINHKDSKLMTLKQFQYKFNKEGIDETGLIAIVPPLTSK